MTKERDVYKARHALEKAQRALTRRDLQFFKGTIPRERLDEAHREYLEALATLRTTEEAYRDQFYGNRHLI